MVLTPAWRRCMVRARGRPQRCSRRTGINFICFKHRLIREMALPQFLKTFMDKLWLTGQFLGRVAACHTMNLVCSMAIRPNLELKTQPKQLLGSLPLDIVLPETFQCIYGSK
jgi:hypothetical protein